MASPFTPDTIPGSGTAIVKSASVTLTNAQVKALPGTDIALVAAPGTGKMLAPLAAYVTADFTTAYTGIDANTEYPALWVAHAYNALVLAEFVDDPDGPESLLTQLLTGTNASGALIYPLLPLEPVQKDSSARGYVGPVVAGSHTLSDYENVSLKIGADNSGDFTGGNAANTLAVTVLYTVLDV